MNATANHQQQADKRTGKENHKMTALLTEWRAADRADEEKPAEQRADILRIAMSNDNLITVTENESRTTCKRARVRACVIVRA
jgi:hypothetical protein